jgi:hypothetical protein
VNKRTEVVVVHVNPELKARLQAAADEAGLKLSPYCYSRLKLAENAKDNRDALLELLGATTSDLALRRDAFERAMRPLPDEVKP